MEATPGPGCRTVYTAQCGLVLEQLCEIQLETVMKEECDSPASSPCRQVSAANKYFANISHPDCS